MTNGRQWSVALGVVMAVVFGVALAIKIRPQVNLVAVGSRAPQFTATDLASGRVTTLADFRGTVVLLNVWATWCQPCRVEMPSLERLHRRLGGADFRVVAVSVDEQGPDVVAKFAQDLGLSFEILHDRSGAIQHAYQTTGTRIANRHSYVDVIGLGNLRVQDIADLHCALTLVVSALPDVVVGI